MKLSERNEYCKVILRYPLLGGTSADPLPDQEIDVTDEVAQLEAEIERLRKVEKVCNWLFEKKEDGYTLKYILVEGEGDKWHIPETIGLALADALKAGDCDG